MHRMDRDLDALLDVVAELPPRALRSYVRLWQLETWLRHMVYVELRALAGIQWQQQIPAPGNALTNDLRLTHMPGPEQFPISYVTFGQLLKSIDVNWNLFEGYLPPKDLWSSKLAEVSQVRNRVAHFRHGHPDDLDRVIRLMRDIDSGFFSFCTSYNASLPILPPRRDPVVKQFMHLSQVDFVEVEKRRWALVGTIDRNAVVSVSVSAHRRPWVTQRASSIPGRPGYIYDVSFTVNHRRMIDYDLLLTDTANLHPDVVYIHLDTFAQTLRITLPAVAGARSINATIQGFLDWIPNSLRSREEHARSDSELAERTDKAQGLADQWPEYVLGPRNPMSFLSPDMKCSFFSV